MKQRINHIINGTLGLLLVMLSVATAVAQKPVIHLEVPRCETIILAVDEIPGDRYTWDIYRDSTLNFAQQKGDVDPVTYFENSMYEGSSVKINNLDAGRYFVRVMAWDEQNCTNNLMIYMLDVIDILPMAELTGDSLCFGEPIVVKIVLTGKGPWDLTYTWGDGSMMVNLEGVIKNEINVPLPPLPPGIHEAWVTQIIDQCNENLAPSERGRIVIYPKPSQSKIYPVPK